MQGTIQEWQVSPVGLKVTAVCRLASKWGIVASLKTCRKFTHGGGIFTAAPNELKGAHREGQITLHADIVVGDHAGGAHFKSETSCDILAQIDI